MPLPIRHRRPVYQLGRPVPFVHQKSNFTLEQLDPEVIRVRRLVGVVEKQAALEPGLQFEFPSGEQRGVEGGLGRSGENRKEVVRGRRTGPNFTRTRENPARRARLDAGYRPALSPVSPRSLSSLSRY